MLQVSEAMASMEITSVQNVFRFTDKLCNMATKTSHSMGVQLTSRNMLALDELELYELCQLAGVVMEPATFK